MTAHVLADPDQNPYSHEVVIPFASTKLLATWIKIASGRHALAAAVASVSLALASDGGIGVPRACPWSVRPAGTVAIAYIVAIATRPRATCVPLMVRSLLAESHGAIACCDESRK